MRKVRTGISLFFSVLLTAFWGSVGMVVSLLCVRNLIRISVRPWGRTVLWTCGVRLEVSGAENLPSEPCIVMYNHQSSFDIPAFSAAVPFEWRAVMKNEVARIPFIGWVCSLAGHYFVARDGSAGDTSRVREIVRKIKRGPSVMIAPEGTRSEDGELLPFKKGGFLIASLSRVPVVPMVLWGGKDIRRKNSWELNTGGTIRVSFLPPIDTGSLPPGRRGGDMLEAAVRERMLSEIEKLRSAG